MSRFGLNVSAAAQLDRNNTICFDDVLRSTSSNTSSTTENSSGPNKRKLHDFSMPNSGQLFAVIDLAADPTFGIELVLTLPDSALSGVSSFLDFKERVSFAMMLPTWKEEKTHDVSKAIIGAEPVESIDFFHFGKDMASRMTDADMRHLLVSANAKNIKDLKLTYCFGIEGHGLEPLCGSSALEKIDLTLVARHESSYKTRDNSLSDEAVVPLLNSILDAEHCSLKYIQLPVKWRFNESRLLSLFLSRYNKLALNCKCCNYDDFNRGMTFESIENRTCYECTVHFCRECSNRQKIRCCQYCEKCVCSTCDADSVFGADPDGCGPVFTCNGCDPGRKQHVGYLDENESLNSLIELLNGDGLQHQDMNNMQPENEVFWEMLDDDNGDIDQELLENHRGG